MGDFLVSFLRTFAAVFAVATVLGLLGLLLIHRRLRGLQVPPNASFATTLRAVPFALVVVLDLLDLGLDVFSAPIIWLILSRYNLQNLRNFGAIEALIPFTGPVPTLSLAWIGVRMLGLGERYSGTTIDAEEVEPGHYTPRIGR